MVIQKRPRIRAEHSDGGAEVRVVAEPVVNREAPNVMNSDERLLASGVPS